MSTLSAEAQFRLPGADSIVATVCDHLKEHGARVDRNGRRSNLAFDCGRGEISIETDHVLLRAEADDLAKLAFVKANIAGHLMEFAPWPGPDIVWTGDGNDLTTPPSFREMAVVKARNITPHMRRVTLTCEDPQRYCVDNDYHVNMLFPPEGIAPEWPYLGRDGLVKWPQGQGKPILRKYTIRQFDLDAKTIDVDFVVHDDAGPGSGWAERAKPGDQVGFLGPGGGSYGEADWYLLAGDETALPAIARILETLPGTARGVAFIEVADGSEEQPVDFDAQVELHWLHRGSAAPGTTTLLQDAVRATAWPEDGSKVYVWAAGEFETFRSVRSYLRKERKLPRDQHYVLSYWRRGDDGINQPGDMAMRLPPDPL